MLLEFSEKRINDRPGFFVTNALTERQDVILNEDKAVVCRTRIVFEFVVVVLKEKLVVHLVTNFYDNRFVRLVVGHLLPQAVPFRG